MNLGVPLLGLWLWKHPSGSELALFSSQLALLALFYSPFFLISFFIIHRFMKSHLALSMIFGIILAGILSTLIVNFSIPFFSSWLTIMGVGLILTWINRSTFAEETRQYCTRMTTIDWSFIGLGLMLVFNLFAHDWIGPFYPPLNCDLSLTHISLPKIYALNQGWVNAWWIRGIFIPQLMHMQFALLIDFFKHWGTRSDLGPALIGILLFLSLIQSSRVVLTPKMSRWFGMGLLCFSLTRFNLSSAYMDLPAVAMVFALLGCLWIAFRSPTFLNGIPSGLAFAATIGVKHMTLFWTLPIILIWVALRLIYRKGVQDRCKDFYFLGGVLTAFAPAFTLIFFQNWRATGNPLFPFLFPQHPEGYHWDAETVREFGSSVQHWTGERSLSGILKVFGQLLIQDNPHSDSGEFKITCLFHLSLIFMMWIWIKAKKLRTTVIVCFLVFLMQYLSWHFSMAVIRYLYPTACLMTLAVFYLVQETGKKNVQAFAWVIFGAVLITSQKTYFSSNIPTVQTQFSEIQKLYRMTLPSYAAFEWLENHSSKDSLVYIYGASCDTLQSPRAYFGDWFGPGNYATFKTGNIDLIKKFVINNDIDYVVENKSQSWPLTKLSTSLKLESVCLESVKDFDSPEFNLLKRVRTQDCQAAVQSIFRDSVRLQPKGYDFLFR